MARWSFKKYHFCGPDRHLKDHSLVGLKNYILWLRRYLQKIYLIYSKFWGPADLWKKWGGPLKMFKFDASAGPFKIGVRYDSPLKKSRVVVLRAATFCPESRLFYTSFSFEKI